MKATLLFSIALCAGMCFSCASDEVSVPSETVGTGGSLARFVVFNSNLYAVDQQNLYTFSLDQPYKPTKTNETHLNFGVETIFSMDTLIFVGTQTGMHMLNVANGQQPAYLSIYEHIVACDPVVAQDTLAFVTLRSGTGCQRAVDQLDVIDIRNVKSPTLLHSYRLSNPHGMAIQKNTLFVCEGNHGLKVYEIQAGGQLKLVRNYLEIKSLDAIIGKNNVLIVMAPDAVQQYDYSDLKELNLLSSIQRELQ